MADAEARKVAIERSADQVRTSTSPFTSHGGPCPICKGTGYVPPTRGDFAICLPPHPGHKCSRCKVAL